MKRILVVLACVLVGSCSFQSALETYCKNRGERTAGERCERENSCCTGFQCVSGTCCAQAGTVCSSSGQCCEGLTCSDGKCVGPEEPDGGTDGGEQTGDGGLPDGGEPVDAGDARIAIVSPPRSFAAGTCSPPITVQLQRGGVAVPAPDTITVFLTTGEETAGFSADSACSAPTVSVDIPAGSSSVNFYMSATTATNTLVQVTRFVASIEDGQLQTVTPGPAAQLAFSPASLMLLRRTCSGIVVVAVRDTYGNPANVAANTPITLTAEAPMTMTVYAVGDDTCMTWLGVPQLTLPSGSRSVGFHFSDSTAGARPITATAPGLAPSILDVTIQ